MSAAHSYGSGAASASRIRDAIHTGAIKLVPPAQRREPMTCDPLRLDSGIPTLTERHAGRHHRNAPHLHLVHRVDTETDLPNGVDGVAIGYTALSEREDQYEARPIDHARHLAEVQDSALWRSIAGVYVFCGVLLALVVIGSRHQTEIRAGLRIAREAVARLLLGA